MSTIKSSQIALEVCNTCMYKADEEAWIFDLLFLLSHCFILLICFLFLPFHWAMFAGWSWKQPHVSKRCLRSYPSGRTSIAHVWWHSQTLSRNWDVSVTLYYEWKIIMDYIHYKEASSNLLVANKRCQQLPNTTLQDNLSRALVKLNTVFSGKFSPFSVQVSLLLNLFLYYGASHFNIIPFLCRKNHM